MRGSCFLSGFRGLEKARTEGHVGEGRIYQDGGASGWVQGGGSGGERRD